MKSSFFARLSFNYKWRFYELGVNIILVFVTFFMGFVCQSYISNVSVEGYSRLSYSDAIISVSADFDKIDNTINWADGIIAEIDEYQKSINNLQQQPRDVAKTDSIRNVNKRQAIYLKLVEPLCDSIVNVIPRIIQSSHIVMIPMIGKYQCSRDSLDKCIKQLIEWSLLNKMRNVNVADESDFKYKSLSMWQASFIKNNWSTLYSRYKKIRDVTTMSGLEDDSLTFRKGYYSWLKELIDCRDNLNHIKSYYSRFNSFDFSDHDSRSRKSHFSLIFLIGAFFFVMAIIIIGLLFIPSPDKNYEIHDLIDRRDSLEREIQEIDQKINNINIVNIDK